jgi:hypothetical protein
MGTAKRIETAEAKALRGRRQRFAAPGGSHDKLVRLLAVVLPMGIGIVAALVILVPLGSRGEVSFLLDRNKVETVENRLASTTRCTGVRITRAVLSRLPPRRRSNVRRRRGLSG